MKAKKILSIALAAAMTASLGAVASFAEEAPASDDSMNVSYYKLRDAVTYVGGEGTLVEDSYGALVGYGENGALKQFDATIKALVDGSFVTATEKGVTSIGAGTKDQYIYKWTGTMTAKESGTYTLIARKIDNGFVMKVNGDKVFEYWGASHWFDGAEDRLVSDEGTFTVTAGEDYEVEIYFLELGGGDALEIWATTTPEDTNSGSNINDAFTFDLTKETYSGRSADAINDFVGNGKGSNEAGDPGNGGQIVDADGKFVEDNRRFDVDLLDKLEEWTDENLPATTTSFAAVLQDPDAYVIKYTGSLTPAESGTYIFGAAKIDNGFYLEIDGKPVYEFWAGWTWNDDNSGNVDTTGIELEAGKAYNFTAYFLETDGGQALDMRYAVDAAEGITAADMAAIEDGFTFSTEILATPDNGNTDNGNTDNGNTDNGNTDNGNTNNGNNGNTDNGNTNNGNTNNDKPAKTGDATLVAVAVAVVALAGAAVVSKKRHTAE